MAQTVGAPSGTGDLVALEEDARPAGSFEVHFFASQEQISSADDTESPVGELFRRAGIPVVEEDDPGSHRERVGPVVVISAVIVEITETRTRGTSVTGEKAEGTPQPTPTVAPSQIEARALLLALSPQDALVLKNLKDAGGTFDIVLRSPTSTQFFELSPVMRQYLIDRYQLEVTK